MGGGMGEEGLPGTFQRRRKAGIASVQRKNKARTAMNAAMPLGKRSVAQASTIQPAIIQAGFLRSHA